MKKSTFLKQYNITEEQFSGEKEIGGSLYLSSLTSIPEGFNPTVGGYLDLGSLTSIPEGFNPTVGGYLDLGSLTSIPEGFNPTVGGSLYLSSLTSIPEGFNPTVGGYLYLGSLTSIPEGFNPTVGGSLYLSSLTSIPEGFNPTVGGSLYLRSLTSIPEGFNPTVGGDLYLRSLTSIPEGFNPTVGGDLYLRSGRKYIGHTIPAVEINTNFLWEKNGKRYAKIDGLFCEIISERGRNIDGKRYKIYSAKKVNREEYFFIANKDNFYAHAEDLKKAISDLQFKMIAETLKKEPIKPDTIITRQYYRLITGACEFGTESWVKDNGLSELQEIKASDLLKLLEKTNAYGLAKFKSLVTF
jgi:hypothetical protein